MMSILNSILPIIVSSDKPEQIGSGVLVKIKDELFILTAAHVIDEAISKKIMFPCVSGLKEFQGSFTYLKLPDDLTREEDSIDIAYFQFDKSWNEQFINEIEPIDFTNINITDISYEGDNYGFVGYPWRKSTVSNGVFSGKLFNYLGGYISQEKYPTYGLNPEANIVIDFNRKDGVINHGHKEILPLPHGISGGAIIAYPKCDGKDSLEKGKVVGICHTYYEKKNIMIGTNINYIMSLIFQTNPTLSYDISSLQNKDITIKHLPMIIGFAYYKREEWDEIRSIMADKDIMSEKWEDWRAALENGLTENFNKGYQVLRIVITVDELKKYSREKNVPLIGKTRIAVVNEKLSALVFRKQLKFIKE